MSKFVIFDLDGVLIDSKKNMEVSWQKVNQTLKYNKRFNDYFKNTGMPFEEILKKIGITRDISIAKKILEKILLKGLI